MGFVKAALPPADGHVATTDLMTALAHPDPVVRRDAVQIAVRDADAEALVTRLASEADPVVLDRLLSGLADIADATAVEGLVVCLRSEDVRLRNGAIDALKTIPDAVAPVMTPLLSDADPDVRIFAINVLSSLRHPSVEAWLLAVIRDDDHLNVCATAVDLLGEVGSSAAIEPLEALKTRFPGEPFIAFATELALDRIRPVRGDPR